MTALCGGGTSGAKLGVDAIAAYTSGRLAQLAVLRGMSWTNPYLPLISLLPIAVSSFCASDPPSIPTFSSGDYDALAAGDLTENFFTAIGKIRDSLLNAIWQDLCECTSGTLTPPVYPAPTSSTPVPQLPTSLAAPCRTVTQTATVNFAFNAGSAVIQTAQDGISGDFSLLNKTVSLVRVHLKINHPTGAGPTGTWFISWENAAGGVLQNILTALTPTTDMTLDFIPRSDADNFQVGISSGATGSGTYNTVGSTVERYCNGAQPGVAQPCCPPDASTQAYLDQLLKMVTLIQRQAVPFGYIPSTSHTGLSGNGTIDISGLIGASVTVTTLPGSLGERGTSPVERFDLGWITFGTPDGYPTSYRLERDSQIMLPARCGAYTEIAYDLHPGVVVTIRELTREP